MSSQVSNQGMTCWERFKQCCCGTQKKVKKLSHYDSKQANQLNELMERAIEPVVLHQVTVEPKKHHFGKSTDMVSLKECLEQEEIGWAS
jgi:hypothetical protein